MIECETHYEEFLKSVRIRKVEARDISPGDLYIVSREEALDVVFLIEYYIYLQINKKEVYDLEIKLKTNSWWLHQGEYTFYILEPNE